LARHALAEGQRILGENRPEGKEAYLFMGDEWAMARYLANQASNAVASLPEGSGPFELKDPADFDALVILGRLDDARAAIDKALTQGSNTNSLPFADTLNDFANHLREGKRYDDAAAIGEQALKIQLRLASTNLSLLIATYGGLAATLDIAKKYSNAAPLLEQRLKLIRSLHGSESLQVSDALGWNAWVYFKDKRFPEEKSALQERLAIQKRHFGSDHTNLLETLDRLGSNLETQGKLQEAEAFRKNALAICEKNFGRDNPGGFNAGAKLSSILLKQHKSGEAQALDQLLALQVEKLIASSATSTNDTATIAALGGLCYTSEHAGKYALAEALLKKRLALQRNLYGNDHKEVLDSLGWMAEIRSWGGKPAEAAEVLQEKIAIQTKLFGRENTNVLGNIEWQANLYEDAGKLEQSALLRKELLDARTRSLGNDHPEAISALAKLCSLRVKQNNLADAQVLCNLLVSRAPESDATWSALTGL
jgi:hypothetical protein